MINNFLVKLPFFKHDLIYDLIKYQDLRLCLDIGAASGAMTRKIKLAGSVRTQIFAFEPFPGNHKYFSETTKGLSGITLFKKAVSSEPGVFRFHVGSVVAGDEKGWESMTGYSSVGFLIDEKGFNSVTKNSQSMEIEVEAVTINDVVDRHVDFMKVDVQGGEFGVLKGCQRLIETYGIDIIYLEFNGDKRILDLMNEHGYCIFDTEYLIVPTKDIEQSMLEDMGFHRFRSINLSTGRTAYFASLNLTDGDYCSFLNQANQKIGTVQTDLIFVHPNFLSSFLRIINRFEQARNFSSYSDDYFNVLKDEPKIKQKMENDDLLELMHTWEQGRFRADLP